MAAKLQKIHALVCKHNIIHCIVFLFIRNSKINYKISMNTTLSNKMFHVLLSSRVSQYVP